MYDKGNVESEGMVIHIFLVLTLEMIHQCSTVRMQNACLGG